MLIPYNTDAPLYHYPISTVTLIVVNVIFFITFCLDSSGPLDDSGLSSRRLSSREAKELFDGLNRDNLSEEEIDVLLENLSLEDELPTTWRNHLMLQFGQGLLPWQWLTSMFMHQDIFHLLGNMFFLWAFGLILEGKLGWWRFAGLYLIMGVLQAMIVQVLMLFSYGAALGASGAIFALLALVVIFAPSNIFETLLLIGLYPITIEISTLIFGFIFVVLNCLGLFLEGGAMSSELLHMIGFGVGLPFGFVMLLRGMVDCEGYDIISYFQGKEGKESTVGKKKKSRTQSRKAESDSSTTTEAATKNSEKVQAMLLSQIDEAIAGGNYDLAVTMQKRWHRTTRMYMASTSADDGHSALRPKSRI